MIVNPLDVARWTFRRSPSDVIRLYNTLADVMRLSAGGHSLNFGLWSKSCAEPLSAHENMARHFGAVAELGDVRIAVDVGCGRAGPARVWHDTYPETQVIGVDINRRNLEEAVFLPCAVNAVSTRLPLAGGSVDRVMALESAQHFWPLSGFTVEAVRVLRPGGILCMAIPVVGPRYRIGRLGLLWLTWSSEHYAARAVRSSIVSAGLQVLHEEFVGDMVYRPLADYYLNNRDSISRRITSKYPRYVETLLHRSMQDMKRAAEKKVIEYMIVKCRKTDSVGQAAHGLPGMNPGAASSPSM